MELGESYIFMLFLNFFFVQIKATSKPVAVGFGISKPEHVEQVSSLSTL